MTRQFYCHWSTWQVASFTIVARFTISSIEDKECVLTGLDLLINLWNCRSGPAPVSHDGQLVSISKPHMENFGLDRPQSRGTIGLHFVRRLYPNMNRYPPILTMSLFMYVYNMCFVWVVSADMIDSWCLHFATTSDHHWATFHKCNHLQYLSLWLTIKIAFEKYSSGSSMPFSNW